MTQPPTKPSRRVLDPVQRQSEVLFGLIMVLTFTGSLSVVEAGRDDVRQMLIGSIGCNVAWGIVDAVMYLMSIKIERSQGLAKMRAVRASSDPAEGRRLVLESLPWDLERPLRVETLEALRAEIVQAPSVPDRARLSKRDWAGAVAVFLLVFLSTFPVVVPFLFVHPLQTALRVSNGVALLMLFVMGYSLARHAHLRPVRTGLAMIAIGLVLVGITMALGG